MKLKIGRITYDITEDDLFLDNGKCVQLTTQPIQKGFYSISPILSKNAIKVLKAHPHTVTEAKDKWAKCTYIKIKALTKESK